MLSLVLALLVTPVTYSLMDSLRGRLVWTGQRLAALLGSRRPVAGSQRAL
jgi:hypothetical protein